MAISVPMVLRLYGTRGILVRTTWRGYGCCIGGASALWITYLFWKAKTFAFGPVHIGTVTSQPTEPVILPLAVAYDLFFLYDVLPRMKYLCMQFYINSCRKFGHFPTSRCRKSIDRSSWLRSCSANWRWILFTCLPWKWGLSMFTYIQQSITLLLSYPK